MKGSGRMTINDDALITKAPYTLIHNFKPSRDKEFVGNMLKSMPREYFLFAEATPDYINFTNNYIKPTIKVSIEPVKRTRPLPFFARSDFGEEGWLEERLRGRLDGSVVLFSANDHTDHKVIPGTTFQRLRTAIKA